MVFVLISLDLSYSGVIFSSLYTQRTPTLVNNVVLKKKKKCF